MLRLLPPGTLEALLLIVLIGGLLLVVRSIRRRHIAAPLGGDEPLPTLTTPQRVTGTLRRLFYERAQGVWLGEILVGKRRFTFAITDHGANKERYASLLGKEVDIALYALATLAPGGVETMKDQIKDLDKVEITPNMVRLIQTGQYPNDYVAIARILSHRQDTLTDETPLLVYRCEVIRAPELALVLELAVPQEENGSAFADQEMVHGAARLFGQLAPAA